MKAILEFDFNDDNHGDRQEHARMMQATNLCYIIYELQNYLRDRLKYADKFESGEVELEKVRETLNSLMYDNGVNLNEIYN